MAYSVQKSRLAKVAGVSLVLLLLPVVLTHAISVRSVVMKPTWKRHRLRSFMPRLE